MRHDLINRLADEWAQLDPVDPLRELISDAIDALQRKPLTDEQIQDLLCIGNPTEDECRLIRLGWNAAHGIKGDA